MSLVEAPATRPPLRLSKTLPPFHPVALRLMRVASSDNTSLTTVVNIVRCDTSFSAELLRLANSPLFGFTRQITGILQAIGLLGMERVRGLALTVALRRFLSGIPPSVAVRICWRHNLACAMIAEEVARAAQMLCDVAYTAGLVHDLGRLALLASDHVRYAVLLAESEAEPGRAREMEREVFGVDHCQAGAALMEEWRFPPSLADIAALHHEPLDGARFGMREMVQLACRTADALGFQVAGPPPPLDPRAMAPSLPLPVLRCLDAGAEDLATAIAVKINSCEVCA